MSIFKKLFCPHNSIGFRTYFFPNLLEETIVCLDCGKVIIPAKNFEWVRNYVNDTSNRWHKMWKKPQEEKVQEQEMITEDFLKED
jgi:hypothetical protein